MVETTRSDRVERRVGLQGFVQNGTRTPGAATTVSGDAELRAQVSHLPATTDNRCVDVAFANGIADTDVHGRTSTW